MPKFEVDLIGCGTMTQMGWFSVSYYFRWGWRLILYAVLAAAILDFSHSGYHFWDEPGRISERHAPERIFSHTADRPFAYRMLVPAATNIVHSVAPDVLISAFRRVGSEALERYAYAPADPRWTEDLRVRIGILYLMEYCGWIVALAGACVLTKIVWRGQPLLAESGPLALGLLLPLTATNGAYWYDGVEQALLFSMLCLAVLRKWALLLPVLVVAQLNKEVAVLSIPLLAIAAGTRTLIRRDVYWLGALSVACIGTLLAVRYYMRANTGSSMENHFVGNLMFWFDWKVYFTNAAATHAAGLRLPRLENVVFLALLGWALLQGWRNIDPRFRLGLVVATAINFPLLLLGGSRDEFRALSLMIPFVYIVACGAWTTPCEFSPTLTVRRDSPDARGPSA